MVICGLGADDRRNWLAAPSYAKGYAGTAGAAMLVHTPRPRKPSTFSSVSVWAGCAETGRGYCSLMLAPTEKVRAMLNRYGVSCPVVTVPTGIDLTAFGPAQDNGEEKARMRAELGHPGRGYRPALAGPSGCREEPRPAGASAGRTAGGEPPVAGVRGRRPRPARPGSTDKGAEADRLCPLCGYGQAR